MKDKKQMLLTTVHLLHIRQLGKRICVAKGHKIDTVMRERGHCGENRGLLSTTKTGGGDEDAGVFSREGTFGPELTTSVPEGL